MSTLPKPFVFVLMPFEQKFNDIYKFGIKGAADDAGAYAERVDEQMYGGGILDRIFNQISKADVIVADMTGRNPNVFYEVGYAHALGKVVLLLTQNADDIPFDLKHRPHTIYGGQIEMLRRELTSRLSWAIAESKKQQSASDIERFSIRLIGKEVPVADLSSAVDKEKLPTITGTVQSRTLRLPIHLRNDSPEGIVGITHIYLFCSKDVVVIPCRYETVTTSLNSPWVYGSIIGQSSGQTYQHQEAVAVEPFAATALDSPDGLVQQFRIDTHFPAVPPGAVEEAGIDLMFKPSHSTCDSEYRLRLHSSRQFYDFRFRLQISIEKRPDKSESKKE